MRKETASAAPAAGAGATARLVARICEVSYESLDAVTVATVKRLIADGIAVAVAGGAEAAPALYAGHVRDMGCKPEATVWGYGFKTTPQFAAFSNAMSMHVLDFEPMSNPPTHAVSPVAPAALALGEALHASGRDIIAACAKGFEMQGRVLLAANPDREGVLFHTPGVVGLMGSAVASAHLLGLDAAQLAHALGIAGSRCSGLSANTGSMVKCAHCGNAAASGVDGALLARRGFTAHPAILEATDGYVETFFPQHFDYAALFDFGHPYRCVDPGMAIKFYPSKYPTHFAISAALEVRKAIADMAAIRAVRIFMPLIKDANRPQPRSGLEGKFSVQYTAAAALLDGRIQIDTFRDERRFAPDMVELLGKISTVCDPKASRDTRNMRFDIEVELNDGTRQRGVCTKPPGTWGKAIDDAEHMVKLRDCLGVRFKQAEQEQVLELLGRLEKLSADELAGLMALLA